MVLVLAIGGVLWGANGHWMPRDVAAQAHDINRSESDDGIAENAAEIQLVSSAFKSFVTTMQIGNYRARMWQLEKEFGGKGCPRAVQVVQDECRLLQRAILDALRDKVRGPRRR